MTARAELQSAHPGLDLDRLQHLVVELLRGCRHFGYRLPRVPVDTVALFINAGYIGVGGGVTFSNKNS